MSRTFPVPACLPSLPAGLHTLRITRFQGQPRLPPCWPPTGPAERNAFSLHNLCLHGRRCGVVPGRWLGPWVVCKTLEAAAAAAQVRVLLAVAGHVEHACERARVAAQVSQVVNRGPIPAPFSYATHLQVHHDLGVTVALLAEAGGGAPLLIVGRFESVFEAGAAGGGAAGKEGGRQRQDRDDPAAAASAAAGAAAPAVAESDSTELVSVDSSTLAVEAPSPAAALAASTHQLSLNGGGGGSRGLILLVPLVLGLGKVGGHRARVANT